MLVTDSIGSTSALVVEQFPDGRWEAIGRATRLGAHNVTVRWSGEPLGASLALDVYPPDPPHIYIASEVPSEPRAAAYIIGGAPGTIVRLAIFQRAASTRGPATFKVELPPVTLNGDGIGGFELARAPGYCVAPAGGKCVGVVGE